MLEKLKQLFTKDKSVELQLIDVIKQQQEFIAKNINERVVYVEKGTGYTNIERFDDPNSDNKKDDDEFVEPEDMTPEDLREYMEGEQEETKKEEGDK